MRTNQIGLIVLSLCFALVAFWDLVCLLRESPNCTVSFVVYKYSQEFPVLPFAFGMLMGHLFWRS
jgi:hypothetical protein